MRDVLIVSLSALLIAGCTQPQSATQTQQTPDIQQKHNPVDITDLDYQGLPVKIGVQGTEALPVQAVIEAEQDLPVALHMGKDQKLPVELEMTNDKSLPIQVAEHHGGKLPVEVAAMDDQGINIRINTENQEPLAVAFGLPPIPPEMILPAVLLGAGLFLLILLPCIAAIASMKAARKAQQITELCFKQMQKNNENPSTPGLISVSMDENPLNGENDHEK